ncbi:AAA family ATPase [Parasphaerochaeta coccoides]|uniref:ORC1/DEAH AAA+ ATPase domain-containing protein n=1 Tax=Parasphaerochaeta coccoides (strain ATCC BAA-1237 / DSM 17374 / SPN1) TaxID=760011 RepID=F4GHU5_PARC1|nr:AAA family ATPase [Parasphaerochaeta coccoides]AEC02058.1 hypothetical protein Spico_0834 [Parasphaerochaeta coccoides DSM 17374]
MTLAEALEISGMTLQQVGELLDPPLGKAAISRIKSHEYPNWDILEPQIVNKMGKIGVLGDFTGEEKQTGILRVDPTAFIHTQNVLATDALVQDLLDPATTLNASIGMITGAAGYGKTSTVQHIGATVDQAHYVLYMEGYTLTALCKQIASTLMGFCQRTFEKNLALIKEATSIYRKVIILDEVDRMPIRYIEALRNINEYCGVPLLLVGEESLTAKMESLPRLKSRVRKPQISFKPLNTADVAMFYLEAVGLDIRDSLQVCKILLSRANRDFRVLVNDAQHLVKAMNASGYETLTEEVLDAYRTKRT